jgi:hypothetical protein
MSDHIGDNALRLAGEIFVPGASELISGNVGSGLLHNLLARAAGVGLIASGVAPVIGGLAVLGVGLNSYTSATKGRNLWEVGSDAIGRRRHEIPDPVPARSTGTKPTNP